MTPPSQQKAPHPRLDRTTPPQNSTHPKYTRIKSAFKAEQLGYTRVRVYAAGYPDWIANGHMGAISVPYLKKLMDEGAPMTLIDSRPKERKYDKGHIPGAVSLPDSQFDKLVDRLPADKASPLYFYCEGLSCKLSSDSAARAVKLGYTAVKVVPEGYPEWVRLYGAGAGSESAAAAPAIAGSREIAPIDFNGQVLRLTRRDPMETGLDSRGIRVVAWTMVTGPQGPAWSRWQSGPPRPRRRLTSALTVFNRTRPDLEIIRH